MAKTNQLESQQPSGMLTLTGQVTLTNIFLAQLREDIGKALRDALEKHLTGVNTASLISSKPETPDIDRGIQLSEAERTAAARARTHSGVKLGLKDGQGLVDTKTLARFLDISPRTLFKMMVTHEMPTPISFGRTKRWVMEEIQAWVYAGCPGEQRWNHTKKLAIRDFRTWSTPVRP